MITQDKFEEVVKKFESIEPILVVGDIGVDKYTKGVVNRISPEAPVPVLEVQSEWQKLGLAANVSDNLQALGAPSTLCGVIGNDINGNQLEALLEDAGLKTWGIVRCDERMTTFKERAVTETQQICRIDYESKHDLSDETFGKVIDRYNEFFPNHSAMILEDYGKGLFTQKLTQTLIKEHTEKGKMVAVDPSRSTNPLFYKGATLLKPNKIESELMVAALGKSNMKTTYDIMNTLVEKLDIEKVIVTLGPEGMALLDRNDGDVRTIPTIAKEVYDVSGAGDTVISAITASLTAGASLTEAAWIGNCAAGIVVGKKGTALVTPKELFSYYSAIKNLEA
jgi:rfaE bifunctional protein kinase chain/domain